ncbi:MAG: hypothetical protein KF831_10220 [Acidobacteria bacterium]|nr:hypothetical protein [Acidobacteriota bacterium]
METWQVLEQAIPRAASKRVALILNVTADYVRRWRREPESDEALTGSGQRSILDRICDLIDAVYLVNPPGAALIVNHIVAHHSELVRVHAKPLLTSECRAEESANLLTQAAEAINNLNVEGCSNQTLIELLELRDAADTTIRRVQKTMNGENQQ